MLAVLLLRWRFKVLCKQWGRFRGCWFAGAKPGSNRGTVGLSILRIHGSQHSCRIETNIPSIKPPGIRLLIVDAQDSWVRVDASNSPLLNRTTNVQDMRRDTCGDDTVLQTLLLGASISQVIAGIPKFKIVTVDRKLASPTRVPSALFGSSAIAMQLVA